MATAERDVHSGLIKIDNITLEQVRELEDTVIAQALRHLLDVAERDPHEIIAKFTNYI